MKWSSEISGKQRLKTLIGFALAVSSISAMAANCDTTQASITGCVKMPDHGCAINPSGIPCIEDRDYDNAQPHDEGYWLRFIDYFLSENINIVPRASLNSIQASCSSSYDVRLASAKSDIAPYIAGRADLQAGFRFQEVIVKYTSGEHEIWRVSNWNVPYWYQPGISPLIGVNASGGIWLTTIEGDMFAIPPTCG